MYVYMCVGVCTRMFMRAGGLRWNHHPSVLLTGRISQSNPEPVSLACSGDPQPLPSVAGLTDEVPYTPGIYVGSGDPNPGPQLWNRLTLNSPPSL